MLVCIPMKTLLTIVGGLAVVVAIISAISWFTAPSAEEEHEHLFYVNGLSNEDFSFSYELGLYLPIGATYDPEIIPSKIISSSSFATDEVGFRWDVAVSEYDTGCEGAACSRTQVSTLLPDELNDIEETKTPLAVTINEVEYTYELVASANELFVRSSDGLEVSNRAQLYPDGIGRIVIDREDTPIDCKELTRLQLERLVTQNQTKLARDAYPGIEQVQADPEVILIQAEERMLGDLLAIDSLTGCKAYIDIANLVQVTPAAL